MIGVFTVAASFKAIISPVSVFLRVKVSVVRLETAVSGTAKVMEPLTLPEAEEMTAPVSTAVVPILVLYGVPFPAGA
ncbi:hypothetical protein D3C71_2028780 [compost metagenome]